MKKHIHTNPVGRLVKSATTDLKTATVNSYDVMGRIKNQWQCTPQNCGTGYFSLPYGYDFAGNITSAGNGMGTTIGYGFDGSAALNSVTSTLVDANHPGTLFSNPTYSPFGAIVFAKLGNGMTETRAYNTRLWLQSVSATSPIGGTATAGSGSVTIGGPGEQSKPPTAATSGTGWVSISGSDRSVVVNACPNAPYSCYYTVYDGGSITVTVNGVNAGSASYGNASTPNSLATDLVTSINGNAASPVTASASGSIVYLTAKTARAAPGSSEAQKCHPSSQLYES